MVRGERKLHEYLYIDINRIDSYAEQIRADSVIEKIPEWKTELSITGPKVVAAQKKTTRPSYKHEKVEYLLDWLSTHKMVFHMSGSLLGFVGSYFYNLSFVHAKLEATRVIFPLKNSLQESTVAAWFASNIDDKEPIPRKEKNVSICLLEDFILSDKTISHPRLSFYSALVGLLWENRDRLSVTELTNSSDFKEISKKDYLDDTDMKGKYLFFNPLNAVEKLGGVRGKDRRIEVLFRIREVYVSSSAIGVQIYGYPIFIREDV